MEGNMPSEEEMAPAALPAFVFLPEGGRQSVPGSAARSQVENVQCYWLEEPEDIIWGSPSTWKVRREVSERVREEEPQIL